MGAAGEDKIVLPRTGVIIDDSHEVATKTTPNRKAVQPMQVMRLIIYNRILQRYTLIIFKLF